MSDGKENSTNQAPAQEKSAIQTAQDSLGINLGDITSTYKEYMNLAKDYGKEATTYLDTFNTEGPAYISQFKKENVFTIDPYYRHVSHLGVTFCSLALFLKFKRGIFTSLRDSGALYLTYGLFVNPESINPFLK